MVGVTQSVSCSVIEVPTSIQGLALAERLPHHPGGGMYLPVWSSTLPALEPPLGQADMYSSRQTSTRPALAS